MGWLTELLQHLRLSRSAIVALFMACFVLSVGPYYYPDVVKRVPDPWAWLLQGILAFTTVLLVFWTSTTLGRMLSIWYRSLIRAFAVRNITTLEEVLLGMLAQDPNKPLLLDSINRLGISKLHMVEAAEGLHRKGLAKRDHSYSNTVWITAAGRKRVLKLQSPAAGAGTTSP